MKTKRIILTSALIIALLMISSQSMAAANTLNAKATPPGAVKTPGAMATQKAVEKAGETKGNSKGKHENYKGTITAADAGSITLELKDGSSVSIILTEETDFHIPTKKDASASGLEIGMTAMVQAVRGEDDSLTARKVILVPGKPAKIHRVGIITAYAAGASITIQSKDEQSFTFILTDETKILPKGRSDLLAVGALVTIIAPRNVSTLDAAAAGIVIHPEKTAE